jgi:hypothetical protein
MDILCHAVAPSEDNEIRILSDTQYQSLKLHFASCVFCSGYELCS